MPVQVAELVQQVTPTIIKASQAPIDTVQSLSLCCGVPGCLDVLLCLAGITKDAALGELVSAPC
jgi:hypothetical protein